MKSITKGIIFLFMLLLVGFTILKEEFANAKGSAAEENAATFSAMNNSSALEKKSIIQFLDKGRMLASWYGSKFHGKVTANGEVYDQMAFTAAHKCLKFGTLLKLTNPKNNKSVIVRINDRGPFIGRRDLDLSKGAALALGMVRRGVIKLEVSELSLADKDRPLLALN